MATYEITSPDGGTYEITAPDDATEDQVLQYAQAQFGGQQAKQPAAAPQAYDPSEGGLPFSPFGIDTGLTMPQGVSRALAGAGKAFADTGSGLRQLGSYAADVVAPRTPTMTDIVTGQDPSRSAEIQKEIDETKRLDAPLMQTGAGIAGNVGGHIATALAPGFALKGAAILPQAGRIAPMLSSIGNALIAPKTVKGAMALGAGLSGIQPVASDESRLAGMALGAAAGGLGQLAGKGIARAVKPVRSTISGSGQDVIRRAEKLGAKATPGMRSGSAALRQVEAGMESFPVTAGKMGALKQMNQKVLNRAATKAIGENADELSEEVLGRAFTRIGNTFDDAAKGQTIALNNDFLTKIGNVEKNYQNVWGGRGDNKFAQLIDDALDDAAKGGISGDRYIKLRSEMSKMTKDAFSSQNSRLGHAIEDMVEALDDAAHSSLPADKMQALQQARSQWRNMRLIEKSLNGENVSGAKLANLLRKADPKGFTYGGRQNDLYDMARFADQFRPIVGDSGTATRLGTQMLAGGAGGSAIGALTGQDPMTMFALGAGVPMAMRGAQGAYLSKPMQQYLAQGLLGSGQVSPALINAGRSLSVHAPIGLLDAVE